MNIPNAQLVIPQWLALPMEVRLKLKKIFNIPKSEGVNVVDGRVVSDGHTHPDLARISVPGMQSYLGSTSSDDFFALFEEVLHKVSVEIASEIVSEPIPVISEPITLKVGDKTFVATEVGSGLTAPAEPLYPTAPTPVVAPIKKVRAKKAK